MGKLKTKKPVFGVAEKFRNIEQGIRNLMEFMRGAMGQFGDTAYKISLTQQALIEHFKCEAEVSAICERIEKEREEAYRAKQAEADGLMATQMDRVQASVEANDFQPPGN